MEMNILIPCILSTLFGGGVTWIFTIRAIRRKVNGEATQMEAEGWKTMQDVYQQTIEDLKQSCSYIREDRSLLREENKKLREENNLLREKYNELEKQILDLRKEMARQGRKLEGILPFTCGLAGCANRTRVDIQDSVIDGKE